jgi:hypothetical protein
MPPDFVLEFGEWLYNARTCLDYIVWATAAYVTGELPPPGDGTLQYPIYESMQAWKHNERRLADLAPHHRAMLLHMQPFNSDADANYLRVVNDLARIDRHRRLTVSTAYLAELEPVIAVPHGSTATLEWGERVLIDGCAQVARISISPWTDDMELSVNPRIGIDPEIAEWGESAFWSRVRFTERLRMIQVFLSAEIAVYEYDCTLTSRKAHVLAPEYRAQCDERGPQGPIRRQARPPVIWGQPSSGNASTRARFEGHGFPRGAAKHQDT